MKLRFKNGIERGFEIVPLSPSYEGRFGRMFGHWRLAEYTYEELSKLVRTNNDNTGGMISANDPDTPETDNPGDDEENAGIPDFLNKDGKFKIVEFTKIAQLAITVLH